MRMKTIIMMLALLFLAVGLVGCAGGETREPEMSAVPPDDTVPIAEPSVIQFETIQVSIRLPDGWEITRDAGSPLPGVDRTYNFRLIPRTERP